MAENGTRISHRVALANGDPIEISKVLLTSVLRRRRRPERRLLRRLRRLLRLVSRYISSDHVVAFDEWLTPYFQFTYYSGLLLLVLLFSQRQSTQATACHARSLSRS